MAEIKEIVRRFAPAGVVAEFPNRYCGPACACPHEPWLSFMVHGAVVVVGRRKRVINIEASRPGNPFDVRAIAQLAKRDDVSFGVDGGWHNWSETSAGKVYVHAWNEAALGEYLEALVPALRGGLPAEDA